MDKLSEALGIEPLEEKQELVAPDIENQELIPAAPTTANPEDEDFEKVRANQNELIDMSRSALNTAIRVASESESPRALEVLGQLLKTANEVNRQLITIGKDKNDVTNSRSGAKTDSGAPTIGKVEQAVFVGNGADLNELMKQQKELKKDE